jgi:hypothetical protein
MLKHLLLLSTIFGAGLVTANEPAPRLVKNLVPVDEIYSPKGFDDNDFSEIVVSGYLPNLCYKSPTTSIKREGYKIVVTLESLHVRPVEGEVCAEMIVPFFETVQLGVLPEGDYKIEVNGKSVYRKLGKLSVTKSFTSVMDDFLYANVEYVDKSFGSRVIKLKGHNPSDCYELEDVRFAHNGTDTYSILPKMKQVRDFCPMKMMPFEYSVEVPKTLKAGTVLLHVRSMNGKSVNTLFPNYSEDEVR